MLPQYYFIPGGFQSQVCFVKCLSFYVLFKSKYTMYTPRKSFQLLYNFLVSPKWIKSTLRKHVLSIRCRAERLHIFSLRRFEDSSSIFVAKYVDFDFLQFNDCNDFEKISSTFFMLFPDFCQIRQDRSPDVFSRTPDTQHTSKILRKNLMLLEFLLILMFIIFIRSEKK